MIAISVFAFGTGTVKQVVADAEGLVALGSAPAQDPDHLCLNAARFALLRKAQLVLVRNSYGPKRHGHCLLCQDNERPGKY
jgi:hypothetical protein